MFDSSFTALKGILSRSFIVGAFLPVLVALAVNAFLTALATKGLEGSITYLKDTLNVADVATAIGVLTLVALPLAFTFSSLLTPFRRLLEGEWLPSVVREDMLRATRRRGSNASTEADLGNKYVMDFARCETEANKLEGVIDDRRKTPNVTDVPLITAADQSVAAFKAKVEGFRATSPKQFKALSAGVIATFTQATTDLETALKANAIDAFDPAVKPAEQVEGAKLGKIYDEFLELINAAHEDARLEAGRRSATMDRLLIAKDPRPTRLGNIRAQFEDYTMAAYEVSFDYLWPRLRMGIDESEDKFEPVEQAETQLSFSLMLLLQASLSSFGWLLGLALNTKMVSTLIVAAIGVPIILYLFYSSVVESQRTLLEVTKAAIDRLRLPLLKALRATEPKTYADELDRWKALASLSLGHLKGQNFPYADPPA